MKYSFGVLSALVITVCLLGSYHGTKALFSSTASSVSNTFAAATTFPTPTPSAPSVVISEVQIRGTDSGYDFVELYNVTDDPIDLSGWKIKKRGSTGSESTLVDISTGTIPAHGYFLWGSDQDSYATSISADVSSDNNIGIDNSLALVKPSSSIADQVAWGSGTSQFVETTAFTPSPDTADTSIERKALSTSDATDMASGGSDQFLGNGFDSDDNSFDFVTRTTSEPQNSGDTVEDPTPLAPVGIADHVVISEIQIASSSASGDFIELYNPTNSAVDISGWKLKKKASTGTEGPIATIDPSSSIPAHGFFLWANSTGGYAASIGANESTTSTIAANNSIALFLPDDTTIIDQVTWGTGTSQFVEGTAFVTNPGANESLERKALISSDATAMMSGTDVAKGNGYDTDDNVSNFVLRTTSQPQNTSSGTETP